MLVDYYTIVKKCTCLLYITYASHQVGRTHVCNIYYMLNDASRNGLKYLKRIYAELLNTCMFFRQCVS